MEDFKSLVPYLKTQRETISILQNILRHQEGLQKFTSQFEKSSFQYVKHLLNVDCDKENCVCCEDALQQPPQRVRCEDKLQRRVHLCYEKRTHCKYSPLYQFSKADLANIHIGENLDRIYYTHIARDVNYSNLIFYNIAGRLTQTIDKKPVKIYFMLNASRDDHIYKHSSDKCFLTTPAKGSIFFSTHPGSLATYENILEQKAKRKLRRSKKSYDVCGHVEDVFCRDN